MPDMLSDISGSAAILQQTRFLYLLQCAGVELAALRILGIIGVPQV